MSRTKSDALDYFPLDVGFFKDPRIRRLTKRFGADGPAFYLYTLCTIYGDCGYYAIKNDEFIEDAAIDLECTTEKIGLMLEYLLNRSLLQDIPLSTVNYLTSHGIQAQYQRSIKGKKRDVEVNAALWILEAKETEGFIQVRGQENKSGNYPINPGNKTINPGNKPQSKVKESKVKESKVKRVADNPPTREEIHAYALKRKSDVNPDRFFDYFDAGGWIDSKGNPVRNWKQKFVTWENNRNGIPAQKPPTMTKPGAIQEPDASTVIEKTDAMRRMLEHTRKEKP